MLAALLCTRSAEAATQPDKADAAFLAATLERVPLPRALRSTAVFESATDPISGSGFQTTVAATPEWITITSAQQLDGVGLAITRITFDDSVRCIQYNVSESDAIVMPGRYHLHAPVGNAFQATPLVWMRLLDAVVSGELATEVTRSQGTIAVRSGAYTISIDEATAEIRRADISGSGFVTSVIYSEWMPVTAQSDGLHKHPTRLTMSMTADGVERARREFSVGQIEILVS